MAGQEQTDTTPEGKARRIVKFWHHREWLTSASSIHVHPLDLDKLEELIATELAKRD